MEQLAHTKCGCNDKPNVAHQVLRSGHDDDKRSLQLVRHVIDRGFFDVYETLEIIKGNSDRGPICFIILQFIKVNNKRYL